MNKLFAGLIILGLVLAACAGGGAQTEAVTTTPEATVSSATDFSQYQDGQPFRFAHTNRQHPIVRLMMAGFFQACEDFGLECVDMGVDFADTGEMVAKLDESIALGSSGIVTGIYDEAFYAGVNTAIEQGVEVVSIHTPIEEGTIPGLLGWASTDPGAYAIEAAHAMAKKVECKGPIAITQGSLNDTENAVAESFAATMREDCPGIEVLPVQIEGFDSPQAILTAAAILLAYPELTGALSTTGNGPTTWAKAAQEVGKAPGEVAIISMDYSRPNLDLVKSGEVYALVAQPIYEEVYYAVVLLLLDRMGLPVTYANKLPAPLIYADNVDFYYSLVDMAEQIEVK